MYHPSFLADDTLLYIILCTSQFAAETLNSFSISNSWASDLNPSKTVSLIVSKTRIQHSALFQQQSDSSLRCSLNTQLGANFVVEN